MHYSDHCMRDIHVYIAQIYTNIQINSVNESQWEVLVVNWLSCSNYVCRLNEAFYDFSQTYHFIPKSLFLWIFDTKVHVAFLGKKCEKMN